jgi:hypothetical protein
MAIRRTVSIAAVTTYSTVAATAIAEILVEIVIRV